EMGRADPRERRGDRVDRGFPQRERPGCPPWMRKLPRGGDLSPVSVSIGNTLIGRDFCHPSRPWLGNFMGDVGCGRLACADPLRPEESHRLAFRGHICYGDACAFCSGDSMIAAGMTA